MVNNSYQIKYEKRITSARNKKLTTSRNQRKIYRNNHKVKVNMNIELDKREYILYLSEMKEFIEWPSENGAEKRKFCKISKFQRLFSATQSKKLINTKSKKQVS
jgi:hypothetical protein